MSIGHKKILRELSSKLNGHFLSDRSEDKHTILSVRKVVAAVE